jgi:hypothetical protein
MKVYSPNKFDVLFFGFLAEKSRFHPRPFRSTKQQWWRLMNGIKKSARTLMARTDLMLNK